MENNKLDKLINVLGKDTASELEALTQDQINKKIVLAEQSMEQAKKELEENPNYKQIKENLKALSLSMKEVNKRQKAIIKYCLHLLESKGL